VEPTRAFLAFDVSEGVLDALDEAGLELKKTGADVGIVARENLHFTVKFLGEIPEDAVKEIDSRVGELQLSAFEAEVRGVGVFPDLKRPRIVWAGVGEGDESMRKSAESVIGALEGIGQRDERGFRPHLTFGRVRSPRSASSLASYVTANVNREFGRTRIGSLKLKSSLLTPGGPVYTDLRGYALR
jgi:RNA 2',3'-cyclic 3'-phosphodiesterase